MLGEGQGLRGLAAVYGQECVAVRVVYVVGVVGEVQGSML